MNNEDLNLVNYKLSENKSAIDELREDIKQISKDYSTFNSKVWIELTEIKTKLKTWVIIGSFIIGIAVNVASKFIN